MPATLIDPTLPELTRSSPGRARAILGAVLVTTALLAITGGIGYLLVGLVTGPLAKPSDPASLRAPSADEIAGLVAELGSDDWTTRSRATRRLISIGEPALPALREALESEDPEVVWRAEEAIREIEHAAVDGPVEAAGRSGR